MLDPGVASLRWGILRMAKQRHSLLILVEFRSFENYRIRILLFCGKLNFDAQLFRR